MARIGNGQTAAVLLATLAILSGPVQAGEAAAACDAWREQARRRLEETEGVSSQTRSMAETTPSEDGQGASAERAALELKRDQLAQLAARVELDLVAVACDASHDATSALERRHRVEELQRRWLQLDCHRMGKELAIAELERSAGAGTDAESRVAFYAPRVDSCIETGQASGEVRYPTQDGGVVHARLRGGGERGVVLAHGGRFTKESWDEQAEELAGLGYRVLAFDFRGRGRSRGPEGTDGEYHDVLASVRYLRSTGSNSVAVVGASFGGGAAAKAATVAEAGEIVGLVLLAHSVIDDPERMSGRKLFIVARDDVRGGGVRRLDEIRRQYEAAPGPKELLVLEGAAHAQFLFETDQTDRLMRAIVDFLDGLQPDAARATAAEGLAEVDRRRKPTRDGEQE